MYSEHPKKNVNHRNEHEQVKGQKKRGKSIEQSVIHNETE